MKIYEVYTNVNLGTDEEYDAQTLTYFANDCISEINAECGSKYPLLTFDYPAGEGFHYIEEDYPLPANWITNLFMPFVSARVKQLDSSQFEYNDYYDMFYNRLRRFRERFVIPDEWVDETSTPTFAQTDISSYFGMGDW